MKKQFRSIVSIMLVLGLILSFGAQIFAAEEKTLTAAEVMTKETYVAADGTELPYRLYVPKDYDPEKEYSFLLFLHGRGNRGNDNESQVSVNTGLLDRIINGEEVKDGDTVIDSSKEFIIIAPQCSKEGQWLDGQLTGVPDPSYKLEETPESKYLTAVVELIDKCKKDYSLNVRRMYVTGLSMGGFGTWDLLARYPDTFAAAIPMGGAGDYTKADIIGKTPVWTIHQVDDPKVSSAGTLEMVEALLAVGAEVKFTPYFDGVHDAWTKGYAEPDMLQWLYDHTLDKVRIAFVGDSITQGAKLEDPATEAFAALVGKELGDGYIAGNFGKSATSALSSAKKPYIQAPQYEKALGFKADILHIMLGTNDIKNENWDEGKGNFVNDYLAIISSFKKVNPEVEVYVGLPPRIFRENVAGTRSPKILEEEGHPAIRELAEKAGATLIDYFEPLKESGEMFPDFLHPDAEGHKVIAENALKAFALPVKNKEKKFILNGASDWAKSEISLCYAAGIMPEALSADYRADITREEFCQMVVNSLPEDLEKTRTAAFEDCKDPSVEYAYAIGVVNGVSDKSFKPDAKATRQEMAAMIYRAYKLTAPDAKATKKSDAPDRAKVADWAADSVDFLNEAGVMKGDDKGNLKPLESTSREQAVLLVYRAYCSANKFGKEA